MFKTTVLVCSLARNCGNQVTQRFMHISKTLSIREITDVSHSKKIVHVPTVVLKDLRGNEIEADDFFEIEKMFTLRDLFNARMQYGHHIGTRNEHMQKYLFGRRENTDIINLDQSLVHLRVALNALAHIVYRGGKVLFVMHSHKHGYSVDKCAMECGEYSQTRKWRESIFTDANVEELKAFPDVVIFPSIQDNVNAQHKAVIECTKVGILSIGIVDSNVNPSLITYPVPGNDDSFQSIELYLKLFKQTILKAKHQREKDLSPELDETFSESEV